jgi:hypothetical protein
MDKTVWKLHLVPIKVLMETDIECVKIPTPCLISPCGKDSDNLLLLFNIVLSLVLNDPTKAFHPIEEDGLEVFECLVFPDGCHGLQLSETASPSSCASTFHRATSRRDSILMNEVGGEDI